MRTRSATRVLAPLLLAVALAVPSPALAVDTTQRSVVDIQTRWAQLRPDFAGSTPYLMAPRLTAPHEAGALEPGFLQDGLDSINYVRYLAGMPDDVVLDPTYTSNAQHGAVLLAVGSFAHSQPKPADMDQGFYSIANGATSSSNIGWGYPTLWSFNFGCMDDNGTGNIDRVGHRRWLLNPPLGKVGMGFASYRSDTRVFDWSRAAAVDYEAVRWPSAGFFPVERFGSTVPWSITLNPARYNYTAGTAGYTVTLTRRNDGRQWTFTSADTNKAGEYFNVETNGYGVANCFIFRPDPASVTYAVGDVFDVSLTGAKNKSNVPVTLSYSTTFMSQEGGEVPTFTPPVSTAVSIRSNTYSTRRGKTLVLSGGAAPAGLRGGSVRLYVMRPGTTRWAYVSTRALSASGASTVWSHRSVIRYSARRGTYRYKVVFLARTGFLGSASRTISVRVR